MLEMDAAEVAEAGVFRFAGELRARFCLSRLANIPPSNVMKESQRVEEKTDRGGMRKGGRLRLNLVYICLSLPIYG